MQTTNLNSLEAQFFNSLNLVVEPLVRAGFGFPCFSSAGAIVLETTGRKSGRKITVTLLATRIGNLLLLSTVRSRSQWLKNIAANPDVTYWMGGRAVKANAFVFTPATEITKKVLPDNVALLARTMLPQSKIFGVSFAILSPLQD